MKIALVNKHRDITKTKTGFSWTTLLFGCFVPVFRKDWKYFGIMLLFSILTFGLSHIVFGFIYNKLYIKGLLRNGYVPSKKAYIDELIKRKIILERNERELEEDDKEI